MNARRFSLVAVAAMAVCSLPAGAVGAGHKADVSFRHEVQHAIDRGLEWLAANQKTNGVWSTADHPAVTALALTAFMGEPSGRYKSNPTPAIRAGYKFVLSNAKPDGGIYARDLQNYNTAICMMSLLAAQDKAYEPALRSARLWLLGQQMIEGGVGYGDKRDHSDMNNTLTALEALYYSKYLDRDKPLPHGRGSDLEPVTGAKDLNWPAVIHFIESCQNLPKYNKEPRASDDAKNRGGFIYAPGESKAGSETNANGRVALRSYGSISYAGLLSYVYADLKQDDPRVTAVFDWLKNNWSADENPGMGQQGLYYYLHLMTKALAICNVDTMELKDGKKIDWRKEVAMKLINLQKADGSWANDVGRWWEKDPALVTAYAVMSLEMIYRGL